MYSVGHNEGASEDVREMQNGFIATAERSIPGRLQHGVKMIVIGEEEFQKIHKKQSVRSTLLLPL